jgi:hypothetical protein
MYCIFCIHLFCGSKKDINSLKKKKKEKRTFFYVAARSVTFNMETKQRDVPRLSYLIYACVGLYNLISGRKQNFFQYLLK